MMGMHPSIMEMRLSTDKIIAETEAYLRGYKVIYEPDTKTGGQRMIKIPVGTARVNELGVQGVLNYLQTCINPSTVQGNFDRDQYEEYIYHFNVGFSNVVMCHKHEWGLVDNRTYLELVEKIEHLSRTFLSRLIDNKERDSYNQQFKTTESNTIANSGKGIFGFGG